MKAVSKSVSMPESLWVLVEARAESQSRTISNLLQRLAEDDLRSSGALTGNPADISTKLLAASKRAGMKKAYAAILKLPPAA